MVAAYDSSNADSSPVRDAGDSLIGVDSVWKVFGPNPQRVLDLQYRGRGKSFFQRKFGNVVGLQDVSFRVKRGETFVIMGLSGSGKSTMVRCLIRLIDPTSGEIVIDGENLTGMSDKELMEFRRSKMAMVFQHYGLQPHRNVMDNASWGLEVQGVDRAERYSRTREVLELVGLGGWEESFPSQLSGGMQQRVGLARALAVDTDVLLMDEPFSGLDPLIRHQMQDELLRLQTELRKTIVFITHDLAEAVKLGDRVAIMHDGRVAQIGSAEDIVLRPESAHVAEFTREVRLESILTAKHIMSAPRFTATRRQEPRATLRTIGSGDVIWVVDRSDKYIGMLSRGNAERAVRDGAQRLEEAWDYIDRDYTRVTADATFDELIPILMASDLPVPCCDSNDVLVGEVHRDDLAEALAGSSHSVSNGAEQAAYSNR